MSRPSLVGAGSAEPLVVVRGRVRMPVPVGLRRDRLIRPLVLRDAPHLALVVAPPGSGKSTLLAHVAEAAGIPVAWLTLDAASVEVEAMLAHLRAAFEPVVAGIRTRWRDADQALADLEDRLTGPAMLVLDDMHCVDRQPAVDVVRLLVRYQPRLLRIAIGSRTMPEVDVPRRQLTGSVLQLDGNFLRFRTWEVDELFRNCHGVCLRADEVGALTRRTEGWAAGLQLFHLATERLPPSGRVALLNGSGSAGPLTRAYLVSHVLDRISEDWRDFLVRTSVLDDLTAARCDALLGTGDAAGCLRNLERAGLFTAVDEGLVYRYHEVLRAHLLEELVSRYGTETANDLHRRAGELLRGDGALGGAVRSYCRARAWDEVRSVLAIGGASLAADRGSWMDLLPASIRDDDPWVLLAFARRLLADGVLDRAEEIYRQAMTRFSATGGSADAAEELRRLQAWREPGVGVVSDWVHLARAALVNPREHLRVVAPASGWHALALGLAQLVTGAVIDAATTLGGVADSRALPRTAEAAALLGRAMALTLVASTESDTARDQAVTAAKMLDAPVLVRLADGLQALAGEDTRAAKHLIGECEQAGDPWGAALLRLFVALAQLGGADEPGALLNAETADRNLRQLRAPALAAWAAAAAGLYAVRDGRPYPQERLAEVERSAGLVGPLPYALAILAVASTTAKRAEAQRLRGLACELAGRCGAEAWVSRVAARLPGAPPAGPDAARRPQGGATTELASPDPARPPLRIRCLGAFALEVGGRPTTVDGVRPRHRALLRLLCLHADRTLHRESLLEWFWSGREPERAQHSLQVAVSDLRRLLEPESARGAWTLLRRDGDGYRLALAPGDECDVRLLDGELAAGHVALRRRDTAGAIRHLGEAIRRYAGDLLPDDGPAEWVVAERDRLREDVAWACDQLAALRAAAGDHADAARLAREGLRHDRCRDGLWLRLIESLHADGNPAAAAAARGAYRDMLASLGVQAGPDHTVSHRR